MKPHLLAFATLLSLLAAFAPLEAEASSFVKLLPGGIVFPEFNSEGVSNPGTLNYETAGVARILLVPNLFGSSTQAFGLDYAYSSEKWGIDFGYDAIRYTYAGYPPTPLTHALHGAASYRFDSFGIGLDYIYTIYDTGAAATTTSTSPASPTTGIPGELDLGIAYNMGKSRLGIDVKSLNSSPSAIIGYGLADDGTYTFEFNLGLPAFTGGFTGPGATYSFVLASTLYVGWFGVGYRTGYQYIMSGATTGVTTGTSTGSFLSTPLGFAHEFSMVFRMSHTGSLSLRFDPTNYLTLGFTFKI